MPGLSLNAVAALFIQRRFGRGFVHGFSGAMKANEHFVTQLAEFGGGKFFFSQNFLLNDCNADFYIADLKWIDQRIAVKLAEYDQHSEEGIYDETSLVKAGLLNLIKILDLADMDNDESASPLELAAAALDRIQVRAYHSSGIHPTQLDEIA